MDARRGAGQRGHDRNRKEAPEKVLNQQVSGSDSLDQHGKCHEVADSTPAVHPSERLRQVHYLQIIARSLPDTMVQRENDGSTIKYKEVNCLHYWFQVARSSCLVEAPASLRLRSLKYLTTGVPAQRPNEKAFCAGAIDAMVRSRDGVRG